MKYILKATSIYEDGLRTDAKGKPHQEDYIFPSESDLSDDARLFILCDGMGGHDAGEVASKAVCEAMSRSILSDGHDPDGEFTTEDFENAIDAAFEELDIKDTGAEKKMGTTLAFLKLYDQGAFIAHMGDSRVYHIRPGETGEDTEILHVTPDHSLINDLLKAEAITIEEAKTSKQKNVITRAMQPGMDRRPKAEVYRTSDIKAGDYFYLCSDGMLEDPEMEDGSLIRNIFSEKMGDIAKKTLILKNVTKDNRDNHSAFLIQITEVIDPIKDSENGNEASTTPAIGFSAQLEDGPSEENASATSAPKSAAITGAETSAVRPEPDASPDRAKQPLPQSPTLSTDRPKKKSISLKAIIGIGVGIIILFAGAIGYMAYSSDKDKSETIPQAQPKINETHEVKPEIKRGEPEKPAVEPSKDKPTDTPTEKPADKTQDKKDNETDQEAVTPQPKPKDEKSDVQAEPSVTNSENAEKAKEALSKLKKDETKEEIVESDPNIKNDTTKNK